MHTCPISPQLQSELSGSNNPLKKSICGFCFVKSGNKRSYAIKTQWFLSLVEHLGKHGEYVSLRETCAPLELKCLLLQELIPCSPIVQDHTGLHSPRGFYRHSALPIVQIGVWGFFDSLTVQKLSSNHKHKIL